MEGVRGPRRGSKEECPKREDPRGATRVGARGFRREPKEAQRGNDHGGSKGLRGASVG